MKQIALQGTLGKGKFALVDDEDYERVRDYPWWLSDKGYVLCHLYDTGKQRKVRLHRLIVGTPSHLRTDHINGNPLDNRRANLRICTQAENARNRRKSANKTSQYKGVYSNQTRTRWRCAVFHNRQELYIGTFDTEIHAAIAYDLWTSELHGDFAKTNFKRAF